MVPSRCSFLGPFLIYSRLNPRRLDVPLRIQASFRTLRACYGIDDPIYFDDLPVKMTNLFKYLPIVFTSMIYQ